jgi:hypothetical protein
VRRLDAESKPKRATAWKNWRKMMAVSTSAKLPPAVERFVGPYAEIAKEVAKRKTKAAQS